MKISRSIFLWLFPVLVLILVNSRLDAQVGSAGKPVTIRGRLTAVKGQEVSVAAANGEVRLKMPDAAIIREEVAIKLSDIAPGMYLGATAEKQTDGTFRASEVHVFSEDQRGFSEGHRPSSSNPGSTMTNANVEKVEDVAVQDVKGRIMTLKYKDGEVKVFVQPNIPLIKRVPGNRDMLRPGAEVSVQGTQAADNSISASQITVRANQ